MMASDLSLDLVEEILSRVPSTSLKRLRSTCKQWNALFKDKRFAKKHFGKAAKQFQVLMFKEKEIYSISVNLHEIHNNVVTAPSVEFKGVLKDSNNTCIYISKVSHCDGLLLCINSDYSIVVWNPILGETRWIQPKTVYHKFTWFALGYQNTRSSCRIYNILKFWFRWIPNSPAVTKFEIFELSSGSWRVLDVNPESMTLSECRLLLNFDFSTERFTRLCFPFQRIFRDTIALSVVRDEELLVLHQSIETLKLDIWLTTNNIDQTKAFSWSKFFAVDLYTHNCVLSRFVKKTTRTLYALLEKMANTKNSL